MKRKLWLLPAALWAAFLLFTLLLTCVDVQSIGPQGSAVGFATVNGRSTSAKHRANWVP